MSDVRNQRWFPTREQLKDTGSIERSFRQLLTQHYELQDKFEKMNRESATSTEASKGPPPGSGPADTMLLGLRVAPVDTASLADGVKLTFVRKDGNFQFK